MDDHEVVDSVKALRKALGEVISAFHQSKNSQTLSQYVRVFERLVLTFGLLEKQIDQEDVGPKISINVKEIGNEL